jgi:hypothetical protein
MKPAQAYYVVMNHQSCGPFTRLQILELVSSHGLPSDTPCCDENSTVWFPLSYLIQAPQKLTSCGVTETIKIVKPPVSKIAA